jgi:hypothetical protein
MEEIERKIFAQLDDQERGLRTSAFEKLYAHFAMQTPPRFFRDILQELEKGEEAAKKCTALENNVTVLKQASVADHQNFNQRYGKLAGDYAKLQRRLSVLQWIRKYGRGLAIAACLPVLAGAAWHYYPVESSTQRAAVDAHFAALAWDIKWVAATEASDPVVMIAAGQPYWVIARFDANWSHENASGAVVMVKCVHIYASPAVRDAGVFLKAHPYSLFGWGWISWPERGTSCKA